MKNSFNSRDTLKVGSRELTYFRIDAVETTCGKIDRLPYSLKILAREPPPHRGRRVRDLRGDQGALCLAGESRAAARDRLHPEPRSPAGLHRRARRGRSRGHARGHDGSRRRREEDQPAAAGGAGHRPLGAGRRLRQPRGGEDQRRPRVRAQQRALQVPPLGADVVRQLQRRPAGHRHRPPGEPRVPRARGLRQRQDQHRLSGHPRRHRLAHHDGERSRCPRLGMRRHRGRGGHARASRSACSSRRSSA